MPTFDITGPDGKQYEIDGATPEGALAALQKHLGVAAKPAPQAAPTEMAPTFDALGNRTGEEPAAPVRASMAYGDQMSNVGNAIDKGVRMAANGMSFGLADKFAGGMDAVTGRAKTYDEGVKTQRAETERLRKENPAAAGVAEAAGGLIGGAGLIKNGISLAGRVGPSILGRVLGFGGEGAVYGGLHGAGNTYSDKASDYIEAGKTGAVTGAAVGAALPVAGAAAGGVYRAGKAFLGPRIEGTSRGASALLRTAAQADEAGLRALPNMGPEAMLVDAGPAMLGLGQGAVTGTGQGRSQIVNALTQRDAGTGQRLARTLDDAIGPAPVPSRIEAGLAASRQNLRPQYQAALEGAGPVNTRTLADQLDGLAIAERGPAQRAARQVREMLNDPVHARHLSDDAGSLLNTRQAIDGLITDATDPNTIRVLTQARIAVDEALGAAVPRIKQVDAQFAELSRQSEGLQRGSQVFDTGKTAIRPQELADEFPRSALPQGEQIGPSAAPLRIREGARAEVDRTVGTNINDLGALERKLATPQDWNSQKFATVFGEGPRAQVAEALMNNRQFRDSYQKIVQNSQTAQRSSSAAAMEGAAGGNVPKDTTLTGLGLSAVNLVAKALSGASNASTKDEVGRILSSQGPAVQRIAQQLLDSAQTAISNSKAISGLVGSQRWIAATSPAFGRKSAQ